MESDVSDYDEDVILPYSPLSEYIDNEELIEEYILNESDHLHIKDSLRPTQKPPNKTSKLLSVFSTISNVTKVYLSYINSVFVPSLVPFEYSVLKQMLKRTKFTNILVSEDLSVLLNYECADDFSLEQKLSYATVFQQCFQLFAFVIILMIIESASVMNGTVSEYCQQLLPERLIFLCLLLEVFIWILSKALYLHILVIGLCIVASFIQMFLCKFVCYSIKSTVQKTEHIVLVLKKCLRLIQEAELIARGFTSASIPGIAERLEVSTGLPLRSPQRQHPELRKYLFRWTRDIFLFYRHATQDLIINLQSQPLIDFATHAFAALDLLEFGDLLRYNTDSDVEMQKLLKSSDNFSISSLKTVYLLAELQISEFYKFLYLRTSFLISEDDIYQYVNKIFDLKSILYLLRCLQSNQSETYSCACKIYKYYRSIEMNSDFENSPELVNMPKKAKSSTLAINVHNMSLHLKSALKRLKELEEQFEMHEQSNVTKNKVNLKMTEAMFKEIKLEMDTYTEYYQKCNKEIQCILYRAEDLPVLVETSEELLSVKPITMPRCDEEPCIEDEIFEAVVDNSILEYEKCENSYISAEETKNSETSCKLLHELKNVLIVKADEHRIREKKALEKKLNLDILPDNLHSTEASYNKSSETNKTQQSIEFEKVIDLSLSPNSGTESENSEKEDFDTDYHAVLKFLPNPTNSFAASVALLAAQRQKILGISNDAFFSDEMSDDEVDN